MNTVKGQSREGGPSRAGLRRPARRAESHRQSTNPELMDVATDVVELYLAPPRSAALLCADEKSRVPLRRRNRPDDDAGATPETAPLET